VVRAWLEIVPEQAPTAEHFTSHEDPEHAIGAEHELIPTQSISHESRAVQLIEPVHDPALAHCTSQVEPPQVTWPHSPPAAPQSTTQLLAAEQSTVWQEPGAWQSTTHGTPAGHTG
jgi:hypothetical protein